MEGVEHGRGEPDESATPLVKHAVMVGCLTLLSRVTGLVRLGIIMHLLGTSPSADSFRVAVLLPNLFRRFLGEGALYSAFIPLYSEYTERRSASESRIFAETFFTLWFGALLVLTALGSVALKWIVPVLFDSDSPEQLDLTIRLSQLAFWYLLAIGCAALGQAILTARRHFAPPSFAPVVANLAFIASVYFIVVRCGPGREGYGVVWAFLLGGVCQFLFLIWPLWNAGVRFRLRNPLHHAGVKRVLRLLVPGTLGAGVYQINVVVNTRLAWRLPMAGAVASLHYSNLILEFVLGIFVMALNTVGLPQLSRHAATGDENAFYALLARLARLTQFITVPSAVGLLVVHVPMLRLFESGQFDHASAELTAKALRFHVLGIGFVGWNRVLVTCFHARKDLKTPLRLAVVVVTVNLVLAYVLSAGPLEHGGIALAASLSAAIHTACLWFAVRRVFPAAHFTGLGIALLRSLLASSAMAGVCWAAMAWLPLEGGKWLLCARLFAVISAGALTYFALSWALRAPELGWLSEAVRRRMKPKEEGHG